MKWLMWLGVVVGVLVVALVALRMSGAMRWTELIRTQTGQLEAARIDAKKRLPSPARFDARESCFVGKSDLLLGQGTCAALTTRFQ